MTSSNRIIRFGLFLVTLNLLFESQLHATGSSILWADDLASTLAGNDFGQRCATDSQGNVYMTGYSNGAVFFGSSNNGDYDIFTAKIAQNGSVIWGKYFGTSLRDQSYSIALDSQGYPIISGYSQGNWDVASNGGLDILITKFDKDTGDIIFTRLFGGSRDDYSYGVAVDLRDDSIYASGFTTGNLSSYINLGLEDSFVVKWNSDGVFQWVNEFGTNGSDKANGLVVDPNGNVFVTGSVTSGTFDQAYGDRDSFLVKFNNTDEIEWIRQFGSNGSDTFYSVDYDSAHNVVACGSVKGPFYGSKFNGQSDTACIKYDQQGNMLWASSVGGAGLEVALTVNINRTTTSSTPASASSDSIFVSGYTNGNIYPYTTSGGEDMLMMMLDSEGSLEWLYMLGSPADDEAGGLSFSPSTNTLFVVGYFGETIPGVVNYTGGYDAVAMLVSPPFTTDFSPSTSSGSGGDSSSLDTAVIVGASLGTVLGLIVLVSVGWAAFYISRKKKNMKMMALFNSEDPSESQGALSGSSLPSMGYGSIGSESHASQGSLDSRKKTASRDNTWEIDYGELVLEKKIGQGASGIVYRGKWRKTEVACKQLLINNTSDRDIENFRAEAELMRNLRPNKNVLLYYGVCTDPKNPLCIVTEYLPNGNLWNMLQNSAFDWTNALKLKIIKGVASGMYHLAKEKIVHRDLAARNILLTETFEAKISDFGLSRAIEHEDDGGQTTTNVGPIRWMSPEAILKRKYSEKSDVWSFAVFVHEVLTQSQPYAGTSQLQVATSVGHRQLRLNYPKDIPVISDLLERCMNWEPENRPRFEEIVEILEHVQVNYQDQFEAVNVE